MSESKEAVIAADPVHEPTASMGSGDLEGSTVGGNEKDDSGGYALDASKVGAAGRNLQTAIDGRTILIPQPSSDPNDPLNCSSFKKHLSFFIVSTVAFLPDFASTMAILSLLPQSK